MCIYICYFVNIFNLFLHKFLGRTNDNLTEKIKHTGHPKYCTNLRRIYVYCGIVILKDVYVEWDYFKRMLLIAILILVKLTLKQNIYSEMDTTAV